MENNGLLKILIVRLFGVGSLRFMSKCSIKKRTILLLLFLLCNIVEAKIVQPTYHIEELPVSIIEAMARSKPVVTTKHRDCEDEVVDDCLCFR